MKVTSKTFYSIYDENGVEVKLLIKGSIYEAEKDSHGHLIVICENGEKSLFSKSCFGRMFTIHE